MPSTSGRYQRQLRLAIYFGLSTGSLSAPLLRVAGAASSTAALCCCFVICCSADGKGVAWDLPKVVQGSRFNGGALGENLRPMEVDNFYSW
jgi:hypothetical protein